MHARSQRLVIPLIVILVLGGMGTDAAFISRDGPPTPTTAHMPVLLDEATTVPVDLDHDGVEDWVVLSQDGIAQRMTPEGDFLWSIDAETVAAELGVGLGPHGATFEQDTIGLSYCGVQHGTAFHDVNGDGVDDLHTALWMPLTSPRAELRGALAVLDGATGEVLEATRYEGRVSQVLVADLDGQDGMERIVVEESGEPDEDTDPFGPKYVWGTPGGVTSLTVEPLGGTGPSWSAPIEGPWAIVTDVALAPRSDGGQDVLVAATEPQPARHCGVDGSPDHLPSAVHRLDGVTGAALWRTATPDPVRELAVTPDGAIALVREPSEVSSSAGAAGSFAASLDLATGLEQWTLEGGLGSAPKVHDLEHLGQSDQLALSFSNTEGTVLASERLSRVRIVDPGSGTTVSELLLDGDRDTPGATSQRPETGHIRLASGDLDQDGLTDLAVRTDRGIHGVLLDQAGGLTHAWQVRTPIPRASHVLLVHADEAGTTVWTQNDFAIEHLIQRPVTVQSGREDVVHRLLGIDGRTGAEDGVIPLLSTMLSSTWIDVDQDGVLDRIAGGSAQAIFAFDGAGPETHWSTDLGTWVMDIRAEDLDRDGSQDLLVAGHLSAFGVDGATGEIRWAYTLETYRESGSWRDIDHVDMTGDGVTDLVLGYRGTTNNGQNPVEYARVLVVNGATGEEVLRIEYPPSQKILTGVGAGDVTGDGTPDLAVTTAPITLSKYYQVTLFDGATGEVLWDVTDVRDSGDEVAHRDPVEIMDTDDDGDLDVLVATIGSTQAEPALRAHDGATGEQLWEVTVAERNGGIPHSDGMHPLDLGGTEGVVVLAEQVHGGSSVAYVRAFTATGDPLWGVHLPDEVYGDVAVGDVNGDGIDDVAVPVFGTGVYVLDGASGLATGEPALLAYNEGTDATRAEMHDADGDGVLDVEIMTTPMDWPVIIGPALFNDKAGRSKAIDLLG